MSIRGQMRVIAIESKAEGVVTSEFNIRLANGIIYLAANDYRAALRKLNRHPWDSDAMGAKMEIERFFRSGWFAALTTINPEYMIRKLREETK